MEVRFEDDFLNALKKHSSIKKLVKKKVDMIIGLTQFNFNNPVGVQ